MVKSWLLIHLVVTQHALLTLAHHSLRGTAIVTSSFMQSIDQALTHIFDHFKKKIVICLWYPISVQCLKDYFMVYDFNLVPVKPEIWMWQVTVIYRVRLCMEGDTREKRLLRQNKAKARWSALPHAGFVLAQLTPVQSGWLDLSHALSLRDRRVPGNTLCSARTLQGSQDSTGCPWHQFSTYADTSSLYLLFLTASRGPSLLSDFLCGESAGVLLFKKARVWTPCILVPGEDESVVITRNLKQFDAYGVMCVTGYTNIQKYRPLL